MSIDAELAPFLDQVARAFTPPPHTMSPTDFRALVERLNGTGAPVRPDGIIASDELAVANGRSVAVRIYRPSGMGNERVLLFAHGGGWTVGSIDSYDSIAADIAISTPCTVVSVGYALSPEHRYPTALLDCETVADWLIERAAALELDPARVAIGGDSAGANLAAGLCLKMRDERGAVPFRFQLLLYPSLDTDVDRPSYLRNADAPVLNRALMIRFLENYLGDEILSPDIYAMPLRAQSLTGLPPAFISTAQFDPLLDDGAEYARRLRADGVACEYREAEGLVHGHLRARTESRVAAGEFKAACAALDRALAD